MRHPDRYRVLLRVRKQEEDIKAQALARSRQAVQQSERERTSLELTRQAALEHAGQSLLTEFDAAEVRSYYQYERHLAALRDQKDAEIRSLQADEAEKRSILEASTKARQIAEKLHHRRRDAYQQYLHREAQKQLDETATLYAARDIHGASTNDEP